MGVTLATWDDLATEHAAWKREMRDCGWQPTTLFVHERNGHRLLRAHCPSCVRPEKWSLWIDNVDDRHVYVDASAPRGCRCMQWNGKRWVGRVVSAECQRIDRRLVREDMKQRHRIEQWSVRDAGDKIEPAIRELVGELDAV